MNYLIIAAGKLKFTPYLSAYLEVFSSTNHNVDVAFGIGTARMKMWSCFVR